MDLETEVLMLLSTADTLIGLCEEQINHLETEVNDLRKKIAILKENSKPINYVLTKKGMRVTQ